MTQVPIDLDRLRALLEHATTKGCPENQDHELAARSIMEWLNAIDNAAPALLDELEAARAEVERLREVVERQHHRLLNAYPPEGGL